MAWCSHRSPTSTDAGACLDLAEAELLRLRSRRQMARRRFPWVVAQLVKRETGTSLLSHSISNSHVAGRREDEVGVVRSMDGCMGGCNTDDRSTKSEDRGEVDISLLLRSDAHGEDLRIPLLSMSGVHDEGCWSTPLQSKAWLVRRSRGC